MVEWNGRMEREARTGGRRPSPALASEASEGSVFPFRPMAVGLPFPPIPVVFLLGLGSDGTGGSNGMVEWNGRMEREAGMGGRRPSPVLAPEASEGSVLPFPPMAVGLPFQPMAVDLR